MKKRLAMITASIIAVSMFAGGCAKEKTPVATDESKIEVFAGYGKAEMSKADEAYFEKVRQATGIEINFTVPPSSNYAERLNILLASGTYPDLIHFKSLNSQAFMNAVDNGIIIPINDYLKNAPSIKKYTYDYAWDALKVGDNKEDVYGIPISSLTRNDGYLVRADWLKNVGLEIPEDHGVDIELFEEILKRFTENDPDKDGKDNTFGTVASLGANKAILPLALSAFDCHGWQKYSDEEYEYMNPIYSKVNPAYKNALAFTQRIYKKRYIDPASVSYTTQDMSDKFSVQQTYGVFRCFAGNMNNYIATLKSVNADAEVDYFYLKNREGKIVGTAIADTNGGDSGMYGHWSVTSSANNPEGIVKMFDWMLSDDGWDLSLKGVEGVEYENVDGVWTDLDPNDSGSWRGATVRRAADAECFGKTYKLSESDKQFILPMVQLGIDTVMPTLDRGYIPEASKEIGYINYSKTMDETISKIVVGSIDVNEYDKALSAWYEHGGKEYVTEMNDYIKTLEKSQ